MSVCRVRRNRGDRRSYWRWHFGYEFLTFSVSTRFDGVDELLDERRRKLQAEYLNTELPLYILSNCLKYKSYILSKLFEIHMFFIYLSNKINEKYKSIIVNFKNISCGEIFEVTVSCVRPLGEHRQGLNKWWICNSRLIKDKLRPKFASWSCPLWNFPLYTRTSVIPFNQTWNLWLWEVLLAVLPPVRVHFCLHFWWENQICPPLQEAIHSLLQRTEVWLLAVSLHIRFTREVRANWIRLSATSPTIGPTSPPDFNRSALTQRTFGYQQTPPMHNFPGTPIQSHNTSISGPPTQVWEVLWNLCFIADYVVIAGIIWFASVGSEQCSNPYPPVWNKRVWTTGWDA